MAFFRALRVDSPICKVRGLDGSAKLPSPSLNSNEKCRVTDFAKKEGGGWMGWVRGMGGWSNKLSDLGKKSLHSISRPKCTCCVGGEEGGGYIDYCRVMYRNQKHTGRREANATPGREGGRRVDHPGGRGALPRKQWPRQDWGSHAWGGHGR